MVRGFVLPLKAVGRIRPHFIFQLRGRKLFQPVPFRLQFLSGIEQQMAKRGREQAGFYFEAGNLRDRLPISGQLWPVSFAKDFDVAWGNIVRFPIKQKTPASFAVNHDRIDQAFKHAAIVSAPRKWKFRMKQRFIARKKTSDGGVAEQIPARGVPVFYRGFRVGRNRQFFFE